MTLDDKLREIVNTLTAQLKGKYHKQVADVAIAQIKQAFADDKEWHLDMQKFELDGKPLMTGQEWYDRFEKELPSILDMLNDRSARTVTLEAAKKAAGIE